MLKELTELEPLIQQQLIQELTLKSLEHDQQFLARAKLAAAWSSWFELTTKELAHNLHDTKRQLGNKGCKVAGTVKEDDIWIVNVDYRGTVFERRFHIIALKNKCNDYLLEILRGE